MMITEWPVWILFVVALLILTGWRFVVSFSDNKAEPIAEPWASAQTTGNKEIQADCIQVFQNAAGIMAVLADGIGKENTGKVAAQVAADTIMDAFEPYHVLNSPEYLFRTAFREAHKRVQKTIGERRGGASLGAVFMDQTKLYYAIAGDVKVALLRNGEVIPISKGQTINVWAEEAYQEGLLTKNETIWTLEENRIWNYVGRDGFRAIELCRLPIQLRPNDVIVMISRGIFEEVSWVEMEDILLNQTNLQEKVNLIIRLVESKEHPDKDNGSIVMLMPEVENETNQL